MQISGKKLRECSQKEVATVEKSVETLGVDLGTQTKQLGTKEKARRKKCNVRLPLIKKNRIFQKKQNESRCEKAVEDWLGSCESVGRTSGRCCAHRKANIEEADAGSSRET